MIPTLWFMLGATASAFDLVPMQVAGDSGQKYDIVILPEGYTADQMDDFATDAAHIVDILVGNCLIKGDCPTVESGSAFNFYRLEVPSVDGFVTDGVLDSKGKFVRTSALADTAFGLATNNANAACWFNSNGDTGALSVASTLAADAPFFDAAVLLLNSDVFGGCNGGGVMTVTKKLDDTVYLHEFGHNVGALGDEYVNASIAKAYAAGDKDAWRANAPNLSIVSTREQLPWASFVKAGTPVPGAANSLEVSAYLGGAATFSAGVWRPTWDSTMNNNTTSYGPVSYARMMQSMAKNTGLPPFRDVVVGDFIDGPAADLVVHQGVSLFSYQSIGAHFYGMNFINREIPSWYWFAEHDHLVAGDFDGDGRDDLFVWNNVDFDLPYAGILQSDGAGGWTMTVRYDLNFSGWGQMAEGDEFQAGDFDGDGKTDLLATNLTAWDSAYMAIALSKDGGFEITSLYQDVLPSWEMRAHDRFHVGDVDGDGRDDVVVDNMTDWSTGYIGVLRGAGATVTASTRYDGDIAGWGGMAPSDTLELADLDGDGAKDLVLFNTADWDKPYLGLFRAEGSGFALLNRYDGLVDGWDALALHDHLTPADADGDGCEDLVIWNGSDFDEQYLGVLHSDCASALEGSWQTTAELGFPMLESADFRGARLLGGLRDGLVAIPDALTLVRLRSDGRSFTNVAQYAGYIHDFPYHASGWW